MKCIQNLNGELTFKHGIRQNFTNRYSHFSCKFKLICQKFVCFNEAITNF